ncbi:MAG: hypothetical protein EB127_31480, partial [Alphaproteobacteria bacterium]|nr:hypothetical protein [Alphaproteobacteria bacterium]
EYLSQKTSLKRYLTYSHAMKALLIKYSPAFILQHNWSYIANQYLIHWARKLCPNTRRFYYQNGRMSLMWKDDFKARRAAQMEGISKSLPILTEFPRISGLVVDIQNFTSYFLIYKFVPLISIKTTFTPPVNVTNGMINTEAVSHITGSHNDSLFAYLDNEIESYRTQGFVNILKINHPLVSCSSEVFRFLYGEHTSTNTILLLPSYGFTSRMIESGWKRELLEQHLASKWNNAISKLLDSFPGFNLKIKLHPSSFEDPLWKDIIESIKTSHPIIEIIDSKQSAEWHIVQAKVIVGDVSSALWWAALYGNKTVISLDIFGYAGGSEMLSYHPYIYYIDDIEKEPCASWYLR